MKQYDSPFYKCCNLSAALILSVVSLFPVHQLLAQNIPLWQWNEYGVISHTCDAICKGAFQEAQLILSKSTINTENTELLIDLLQQQEILEQKRIDLRNKQLDLLCDEIESLLATDLFDAQLLKNAADKIELFCDLIDGTEYQALNTQLLHKLRQSCYLYIEKLDRNMRWMEAYRFFRQVRSLFKSTDPNYSFYEELKEKALIQSAMEELTLPNNNTGISTVASDIFIHAVKLLDFNYACVIDYTKMSQRALQRCKMLGLLYASDNKNCSAWLKLLEDQHQAVLNSQPIQRDDFIALFLRTLEYNRITINLSEEILIRHFSQASLETLDAHTQLIWPEQVVEFRKKMTQKYCGIGIVLAAGSELPQIIDILPNSPASESPLKPQDYLLEIDGESTANLSLKKIVNKLCGPAETIVFLTFQCHQSLQIKTISLRRRKINIPTVQGWIRKNDNSWEYMLEENSRIGYIKLAGFSQETPSEFEAILNKLESTQIRGLILDLRFNTGGHLAAAVEIADMFIDAGPLIKTQPRWGYSAYQQAKSAGTHRYYPIVVLINEMTASASEVLAGILHDPKYKRAVLVGQQTYGKGTVQTISTIQGSDALLKYTVSHYYLPSGQQVKSRQSVNDSEIDSCGLTPDVSIKLYPHEVKSILSNQQTLRNINNITEQQIHQRRQEILDTDIQLATGLIVLKSKIIQTEQMNQRSN